MRTQIEPQDLADHLSSKCAASGKFCEESAVHFDRSPSEGYRARLPHFIESFLARYDVHEKSCYLPSTFQAMIHGGCVYIMVNQNHTVLYVGVTADLYSRVVEHREKFKPKSFTARYNINKLVYYETFPSIEEAIDREKQLKKYARIRKLELIRDFNPEWKDLYEVIKYW